MTSKFTGAFIRGKKLCRFLYLYFYMAIFCTISLGHFIKFLKCVIKYNIPNIKGKQKSQKRQVKFGLQKKDAHENGAMTFLKHCRQEKK